MKKTVKAIILTAISFSLGASLSHADNRLKSFSPYGREYEVWTPGEPMFGIEVSGIQLKGSSHNSNQSFVGVRYPLIAASVRPLDDNFRIAYDLGIGLNHMSPRSSQYQMDEDVLSIALFGDVALKFINQRNEDAIPTKIKVEA